jgi:hypothetical protein
LIASSFFSVLFFSFVRAKLEDSKSLLERKTKAHAEALSIVEKQLLETQQRASLYRYLQTLKTGTVENKEIEALKKSTQTYEACVVLL